MHRVSARGCLAAAIWGFQANSASAQAPFQDAFADYIKRLADDPQLLPGLDLDATLGILRIVAVALIYLIWVLSADWINRDRYERRVGKGWNVAMVLPFVIFFMLYWIIPFFWVGYPLLFLAYLIPFVVFVTNRNGKVDLDDKVFTKKHIRFWTAKKLEKIGIKIQSEELGIDEIGPPVKLSARGGATERDDNVNLLTARESPGFLHAEVLARLSTTGPAP